MSSSQASGSWVQADSRRQPHRANMPHGVSAKKKAWSASKLKYKSTGCLRYEAAFLFLAKLMYYSCWDVTM